MLDEVAPDSSLDDLEEELLETDDSPEVPPDDIVAYNELRSCADLHRMYNQGILEIQPEFQRDVVWKSTDQTRFIDSLIKQLPIPSMCFAMDAKRQKWIVIDGLQRMATINRFLEGGDWKLSRLDDIDPKLQGQSVAAIKTSTKSLHHYYSRVENLSIPVTVLRCDFSKTSHMEYLFTIFHRLNAGGAKLNNQEIRNCIYGGPFNQLLKELDHASNWRRLNKAKTTGQYRFKYQEVLLRFFAFHDNYKQYKGQLAKFLNSYMHEHRAADQPFIDEKRDVFKSTIDIAFDKMLSGKAPKSRMPIAVLEALLVGIAKNENVLKGCTDQRARDLFRQVLDHHEFSEAALKEGLSKRKRVIDRIDAAIQILSDA